ncbi:MAG: hypothetical protein AABY22_23905 [Nanoarchaeota archaeon]
MKAEEEYPIMFTEDFSTTHTYVRVSSRIKFLRCWYKEITDKYFLFYEKIRINANKKLKNDELLIIKMHYLIEGKNV